MRTVILALAVLFTMVGSAVFADVTEGETLRGLDSLGLVIEDLHEDAAEIGLTKEAITKDVSGLLETLGVRILTTEERVEDDRRPYLYINCNVMYVESIDLASFSIDVEVYQRVQLANGEFTQAVTWGKSYLGIQGRENAVQRIREVLGAYLYAFLAEVKPEDTPDALDG